MCIVRWWHSWKNQAWRKLGLSSKIVMIGKSVVVFNWAVMESFLAIRDNLVHFSYQEKPHYVPLFLVLSWTCLIWIWKEWDKTHILSYRKPTQVGRSSRLRWTGERGLRNSAKNLGVTYGRCLTARKNAVTTKEYLATVYLKHRSLQSWKATYRGWHLPSAGKSKISDDPHPFWWWLEVFLCTKKCVLKFIMNRPQKGWGSLGFKLQ